jgi:TrmH family RNA methyltransferase
VAVGVQNPGNLGALLRTAEAAGATGAFLAEGCADAFSWKALRGSMGSAFRLPHRRASADQVLRRLAERRVRALAAVARDADTHHESDLRGPVAFVLGAEGTGLPERVAAACPGRVRVPMRPPVESLNVSVAAGVLLYEAARQRRGRL